MIRWYFLAAGVLALDQATKWIALGHLARGASIDVLPFLSWTLTCNTGAAFSMFQGYSWVFAVAVVAVSAFLIFEIWRLRLGWLEGRRTGWSSPALSATSPIA